MTRKKTRETIQVLLICQIDCQIVANWLFPWQSVLPPLVLPRVSELGGKVAAAAGFVAPVVHFPAWGVQSGWRRRRLGHCPNGAVAAWAPAAGSIGNAVVASVRDIPCIMMLEWRCCFRPDSCLGSSIQNHGGLPIEDDLWQWTWGSFIWYLYMMVYWTCAIRMQ